MAFTSLCDNSVQIARGDCLELLPEIPSGSVDMVLTDLPYGNTASPWDVRVDEHALFKSIWRVTKSNAAVLLFAQLPFACDLIAAARSFFRYKWVWRKGLQSVGFLNAHKMPLRNHEDILVFYRHLPLYNPQWDYREAAGRRHKNNTETRIYRARRGDTQWICPPDGRRYPLDVLNFPNPKGPHIIRYHPTEKPVELLRYLIRTYTNPGETVLDCTMGCGSTGIAAMAEDRRFVGFEIDEEYYTAARERLEDSTRQPRLFAPPPGTRVKEETTQQQLWI